MTKISPTPTLCTRITLCNFLKFGWHIHMGEGQEVGVIRCQSLALNRPEAEIALERMHERLRGLAMERFYASGFVSPSASPVVGESVTHVPPLASIEALAAAVKA